MSTLIAAVRSLATYVAVSLYVLLFGPPFLLLALATGNALTLYRVALGGVRLGLWLSGISVRVRNPENIQRDRAAVYAVNHASNVEPPILYETLSELFPRLRILYKAELRKLPILVRAFDLAGFVPLERGNREQSLPAIERAAEALREGHSFLIFPEGTRSRTGELLPFKKGGFIMAVKGQAPIVPVAIVGARDAMKKGSLIIRPVRVTVSFGAPVPTTGLTLEDREPLISAVRGADQPLRDRRHSRPGEPVRLGCAAAAVPGVRQQLDHRRRAGALRDRVRRRQDSLGGLGLGCHPHGDPSGRRRADRGGDAGGAVHRDADRRRALRRRAHRQHALQQGRHPRHGQRQPRALHQLDLEHRRRRLRRRPRRARPEVSGGRRDRRHR